MFYKQVQQDDISHTVGSAPLSGVTAYLHISTVRTLILAPKFLKMTIENLSDPLQHVSKGLCAYQLKQASYAPASDIVPICQEISATLFAFMGTCIVAPNIFGHVREGTIIISPV